MPADHAALAPPSEMHAVALTKVRDGQCSFITAEPTRRAICCGAPTSGGSSWCAYHRRIVFASVADERIVRQRPA